MISRNNGVDSANSPGTDRVHAPFAGYLTLLVQEGDTVKAGDKLLVIEALKVETTVTARRRSRIGKILHGDGSYVTGGQALLHLSAL